MSNSLVLTCLVQCDGEFPCKRCKDDGLVCTAGTRKKTEYKQLPRGYVNVTEQAVFLKTLINMFKQVR